MGLTVIIIIAVVVIVIIAASKNEQSYTSYNSSSTSNHKDYTSNSSSYKTISTIDDVITVVGGFYRSYEAKKFIKALSACDTVYFLPEPDNPYDKNAVMVLSSTGLHIGYIPRYLAEEVKDELESKDIEGTVTYEAMGTYEFNIFLRPLSDIEERDNAIKIYANRNLEFKNKVITQQKKESLGYFDIIHKVDTWYDMKLYDKVENAIKPFLMLI